NDPVRTTAVSVRRWTGFSMPPPYGGPTRESAFGRTRAVKCRFSRGAGSVAVHLVAVAADRDRRQPDECSDVDSEEDQCPDQDLGAHAAPPLRPTRGRRQRVRCGSRVNAAPGPIDGDIGPLITLLARKRFRISMMISSTPHCNSMVPRLN